MFARNSSQGGESQHEEYAKLYSKRFYADETVRRFWSLQETLKIKCKAHGPN